MTRGDEGDEVDGGGAGDDEEVRGGYQQGNGTFRKGLTEDRVNQPGT